MAEINVQNEELRTTREATRELGALFRQLEEGDLAKVVVASGGKMKGVMLSVEEYARLIEIERAARVYHHEFDHLIKHEYPERYDMHNALRRKE